MVGLRGGIMGEGLRSVGVAPTSPIQERVLYPAHRSLFIRPGRSSSGPSLCPYSRTSGEKKGYSRKFAVASVPPSSAASAQERHGGTVLGLNRRDQVAFVAPSCIKG